MDKISFMRLWDLYHGLLTPTQQEITDLYFNLDLTLSEIAESKGISRQGVSECLAKCKKQLEEIEQKLSIARLIDESDLTHSFCLTDISRWGERLLKEHPELKDNISELQSIISHDYTEEVKRAIDKP